MKRKAPKQLTFSIWVIGLALIHFWLLVSGLKHNHFTADEPAYIAGGYALWVQGKEALPVLAQRGYPPLLAGAEALMLYLGNPSIPVAHLTGWPNSFDAFTKAFEIYLFPTERSVFATRLPTIWLTVLLGCIVYGWAAKLYQRKIALLALTLLVFDPTLLAHGRLAHTDAGIVTLGTGALYAAWRWGKTFQWRWTLASAFLLGLSLLAKISGLFYAFAIAIQVGFVIWHNKRNKQPVTQGLVLLAFGGLILWMGYGFSVDYIPNLIFPVPAPEYWQSLFYLRNYTTETFALGRLWPEHVWWYYPLAFTIKNPLLLVIGCLASFIIALHRKPSPIKIAGLNTFPLLYAIVAIFAGMNIGYRHLLPIHPFLYLFIAGTLGNCITIGSPWKRWGLALGLASYVVGTIQVFPNELAYFNSLVGGPQNGWRYLADSNADWGQTPPSIINKFLQSHPGVRLSPPSTPLHPESGEYLISVSYLNGIGIGNPWAYEWFQHHPPNASLNKVLMLFDGPTTKPEWLAQCSQPVPVLTSEQAVEGLGLPNLRLVGFDCTQSWLYPQASQSPGVYSFDYAHFVPPKLQFSNLLFGPPQPIDSFIQQHLTNSYLSFEKDRATELPPFVLYENLPRPALPILSDKHWVAPIGLHPSEVQQLNQIITTPTLINQLRFLGSRITPRAEVVEIETWWKVVNGPIQRQFSILAHLVSESGEMVSVADGLGISPIELLPGDVIVQRHKFPLTMDNKPYWLRTGAYWLENVEAWTIDEFPQANAIFLPVQSNPP